MLFLKENIDFHKIAFSAAGHDFHSKWLHFGRPKCLQKFLGALKRVLGVAGRHSKIGPGAPKSTFWGAPPTSVTSFFRACFRIASGIDFGSILAGSDPQKGGFRFRGVAEIENSSFSVPASIFIQNGSNLGGQKPFRNYQGCQIVFWEGQCTTPKMGPAPKNQLLGVPPLHFPAPGCPPAPPGAPKGAPGSPQGAPGSILG